ncbi:aspartate/glutamate racemase family protein [Streptomyces boncukensis]|uniref:Hydantoin racemase n=1 Tax=Streptomyces boncukensis TaxID=2711219 RepID=A0A6G4WU09_9ACTN|nr:aspartate/glutamate racemase family protein [Streptomyces boncukensis]NGO68332.1 Asp/Glu/hydantoin racemase [Streptomyces boncukensis]
MHLLLTNCNTTEAMTKDIVAGAQEAASPGTTVTGLTPAWGPESAEGWLDSYLSAAAVLDLLRGHRELYDAVVLAGFGEHGREGARELLDVPVVDITEAAAHLACLLGRRYGVVTTLDRTRGQIEDSLHTAGVARNCAAVVGTGFSVLDLADVKERTSAAFLAAARQAREAGAEVLVLGCAGMTGLQRLLGRELDMPVVDGVAAAVRLAESLVGLGLTTSRAGSYAKPLAKRRDWGPPGA